MDLAGEEMEEMGLLDFAKHQIQIASNDMNRKRPAWRMAIARAEIGKASALAAIAEELVKVNGFMRVFEAFFLGEGKEKKDG